MSERQTRALTTARNTSAAMPADASEVGRILEQVVIQGDLSNLSPDDRTKYYSRVCDSIGLNPLTKPFAYLKLNNQLTLYAKRDCADQLRRIYGISVEVAERSIANDLLIVHVRATDRSGRRDEDFGVVPFANPKGEAGANTIMKAVTKAKRRVTLSICGLGWLDETEVDSIPGARLVDERAALAAPAPPPDIPDVPDDPPPPDIDAAPAHDPETGEVRVSDDEFLASFDSLLAGADSAHGVDNIVRAEKEAVEERGLEQEAAELVEKHHQRIRAVKPAKPDEAAYKRIVAAMRAIEAQGKGNGGLKVLAEVWKTSQEDISAMPETWRAELTAEKDRVKAKLSKGSAS